MKLTPFSSLLMFRIDQMRRVRVITANALRLLRRQNLSAAFTIQQTRRAYRDLDAAFEHLCWIFSEGLKLKA